MLTHKPDPLTLLHKLKRKWDLEPIVVKAMDTAEGYGWTFDFACQVAREYRRFIVLCLENQQDAHHLILPSRWIADFWHLHILDTEKYIEDCQHCFGFILHHYCGRPTDQDMAKQREAYYMKTFALYRSAFSKQPPADVWEPMPSNLTLAYLDPTAVVLTLTDNSGFVARRRGNAADADPCHETLSLTVKKTEKREWIMNNLDLEPIVVKVMDAEKSNGWTSDFTYRVAEEYRHFFLLCLERRQEINHLIVPSKQVDTFWHLHILDTQKYIEDCRNCFGSILHHFPYFGIRGNQDAINLREAYYKTLILYRSKFGMTAPPDIWSHSKTVLEYVRLSLGLPLSSREGEGGCRFDRSRPRLADLGPSMNSPTKLKVLSKKSRQKPIFSIEKKNFIDLMQLAREYKILNKDRQRSIRQLWLPVSLVWKGLNREGRVRLLSALCFSISIILVWGFSISKNFSLAESLLYCLLLAALPIIPLFFPPDRGGSGCSGYGGCSSGGCGGGGCGG